MMPTATAKESIRQRIRRRYNQLRSKSPNFSTSAPPEQSVERILVSTNNTSPPPNESRQFAEHPKETGDKDAAGSRTIVTNAQHVAVDPSTDIWSAAYREAVEMLEDLEKEAVHESAFLKGVQHLRFLKPSLDNFKVALDLASPLTNIEPTASVVFGVLRSVTAIAILLANADMEFSKQIADMLERISYIDEKGASLALRMAWENDHLATIIQEFLTSADKLEKIINKATLEIIGDIKMMLYDQDFSRWLRADKLALQTELRSNWRVTRADQACEFLLEDPRFKSWYDATESRQLVIFGDKPFHERYKQQAQELGLEPSLDIITMEDMLQNMLETIDRPVIFVIDGLDECDRDSRQRLLKFLKLVSEKNFET
ncbi:hypothetical protein MYU51_006669 [Penicillium brevicompactum]